MEFLFVCQVIRPCLPEESLVGFLPVDDGVKDQSGYLIAGCILSPVIIPVRSQDQERTQHNES